MLPEIRIGYVVAPPAILDAVLAAKHLTNWHSPTLVEQALANFIEGGHLHKHIRRCRDVYLGRRDALLRRLEGDLAPWLEPVPITAGFHLTAFLKQSVDVPLLLRLARRVEVGVYSTAPFYGSSTPRPGLFFGLGAIDTLDIDEAPDRLRQIFVQLAEQDAPLTALDDLRHG